MSLRTALIGVTFAVVGVGALTGCDTKAGPSGASSATPPPASSAASAATTTSAPATAAPAPSAPAAGGAKGLAAADSDKKVVDAVKAALPCKWENWGFDSECAEYKKFRDSRDDYNDGIADKTLVNLLEDPDEKVRYLAANKLASYGKTYRTDKDMASRVVAAAEGEKTTKFASSLGRAIAQIDLEKTGTWDKVKVMIVKHEQAALKSAIIGSMVYNNKDSDAVLQAAMDAVKDADKEVRHAAIGAFSSYGGAKKAEVCKFFLDNIENTQDEYVAAHAASNLASGFYGNHCEGSFDALLESEDKRIKAKNTHEEYAWAQALNNICQDTKASPAQKTKALALAKTLAGADTKGSSLRGSALDAVMKCDPINGKTFVATFATDKEDYVRRHAKDLVNPKP